MEKVLFYGRKSSASHRITDYYMIEEGIGTGFTDMHSYGIRIITADFFPGGGKTAEMKQINNVFYRRRDAVEFMSALMDNDIMPAGLEECVKNYISSSFNRAGKR